jgi:glycosyltransferase involved in cell wall biosynthesis
VRLTCVTTYDAGDVRSWSGVPKFMTGALRDAGCELEFVNVGGVTRLERLESRLRGTIPERGLHAARRFARQIPDGVRAFSPGSIAVALRQGSVFWTDATFASMVDFYSTFTGLSSRAIRGGNELERRALKNCAAAIYSSDWAARSAVHDYGADPAKVHVVSFGANLREVPAPDEIERLIDTREVAPLRLLFAGIDWERKGGDVAVSVTRLLRERGHDARLSIAGGTPPVDEPWMDIQGLLHSERDAAQYAQLYREAHFLLLPSKADTSPIVFNDANAFAVPAITTRVGGIETSIREGVNGLTVEAGAPPDAFADAIEEGLGRYRQLALSSRREFDDRLNWKFAAEAVVQIMRQLN